VGTRDALAARPRRARATPAAPHLRHNARGVETLRLNWGCGAVIASGWINADRVARAGVTVAGDIRDGLDVADDSIDYVVAMHAFQDLPYLDVVPALSELRRVLKPRGVLRVGVPDLERAIEAWRRGDARYFYIPDDEVASLGGKLVVQATWYGSVRTPFTWDFLQELSVKAGFTHVHRCTFRQTESRWPEIVMLDNRERESLYAEAVK
jgi:SAM-dependent methyltransferase